MREPFDDWTADELLGHFVSYRKQASPSLKKLLPRRDFRLYGVCTRYPRKLARYAKLRPAGTGIYDVRWGARDIRLIVTRQIPQERRNALWLMFSAVRESVRYGVSKYEGRLDEMSSTIGQMLVKYQVGWINIMPYTVEDYRKELERNVLRSLTPERRLEGLSQ
ncbi:MAG: hypothetical protein B6245_22545 [Desulfobacteraceae bacterium 4572_88]|nr:MAG: hypothetical protein B6245_22545 [Desulfobacteraceae bacterium 4572_88]